MTVDATTFRRALGTVPTAVSVITIVDVHGIDRGMTVGSFCSLSLSPPLVLACIGDDSSIAVAMRSATIFGVSVLAEDQTDLSRLFADTEARGFGGVDNTRGPGGMLLIDGAAARLECRVTMRYPGGDHTIVVGEVTYADATVLPPLLHHRSAYGRLTP